MTVSQWIQDGEAVIASVSVLMPADVQALFSLADRLLAAVATAVESPSPDGELTIEVDAEQAAAIAAEDAKFGK
jgi:hypothetical protein